MINTIKIHVSKEIGLIIKSDANVINFSTLNP